MKIGNKAIDFRVSILPVIWAWAIAGRRVSRELTTVTRPSAGNLSTTLT